MLLLVLILIMSGCATTYNKSQKNDEVAPQPPALPSDEETVNNAVIKTNNTETKNSDSDNVIPPPPALPKD